MNDKEQTEQDLKEFDEVFNNKTINKMTAKEARELSKTVSPEMVSSILEEIKNQAKNGEYSLYYNSGRINDVDLERLKELGYTIEENTFTINTTTFYRYNITW